MSTSRLDAVYRSILITKFFTKGWGKPDNLRRLFEFRKTVSNRDECFKLIDRDYPVTITKEEESGDFRLVEGHFLTPLERCLPGIVPEVAQKAHFQALLPMRWPQPDYRPVCLHLAGTGDHYFWRRRNLMAKPLLKDAGIGAIILENPFYGLRKPSDQVRSSLHNVSDIFVMGGCLILESLVLFHWCERNNFGPLGVTGLSMGGHMASLAATNWPKPLVLVPCLSWSTASAVFLQGVMSHSINWDLLEDQYLSDGIYREKLSKMVTVVDEAFLAGKKFVRKVSQSIDGSCTPAVTQDLADGLIDLGSLDSIIKNRDRLVNQESGRTKTTATKVEAREKPATEPNATTDNPSCAKSNKDTARNAEDAKAKTNLESKADSNLGNGVCKEKRGAAELELEEFRAELSRLSGEGKISESLRLKLCSGAKFELAVRDVSELNKLNQQEIVARVARKYNIGSIVNSNCYTTSSIKDTPEGNGTEMVKQNNSAAPPAETTTPAGDANSKHKADACGAAPQADGANKMAGKKSRNISELTSDLLTSLPFVNKMPAKKIDISKMNWRDREALQFMRGVMDECTHLSNFSVPFDTSLIIAVCAKHDAYVPREDVGALEEIWPGAEVRYVDAGHVSAYLLHQSMFRSCIIEAFERSKEKWKDGKHVA